MGCRVWTESGLRDHGHDRVNVPEKTGGTVEPQHSYAGGLYGVRWDTGQHSVHYDSELFVIGTSRDLREFEDGVVAEAARVSRVLGPQGGNREFTIFLRNGDWVRGLKYFYLLPRLEAENVPVKVEQLARKKPTR